jgi:predicted nuclease of restriction endonuclease-like RecB superfamily
MLRLDGPLSLFTATNKYGLQLALFLPTILLCRDFELRAELRWGPERKPKNFSITPRDGLITHAADTGTYVPPELAMFVELFRKKITGWDIVEETDILPLGNSMWVPDYRLIHRATQKMVYLEVLGFWRRSSVEAHLARLRQHAKEKFVLAVSEQLNVEEVDLDSLPAGIHRFRNMPLPDEIVRLAEAQLANDK